MTQLRNAWRLPVLLVLVGPATAAAQFRDSSASFTRGNPAFMKAFREVVAKPSASTVRIQCDGKDTALGMIVGPDGWILTKANDLKGEITVKVKGTTYEARWVGAQPTHDLALLKIDASGFTPIDFSDSKKVGVGNWVACVGVAEEPVAVGIIGVATRNKGGAILPSDPSKIGWLGVGLNQGEGHPQISAVEPNSPAAKAGFKLNDLVVLANGKPMADPDQLIEEIARHKPGDEVAFKVRRGEEELELKPTLGKRPANMLRGDFQNRMGSELSSRRSGYPTFFQHDSVMKPSDCGGPIVDLEGRVIGINICRAGRTESWAVPAEVIQPLLLDMMSGKLPPKVEAVKLTPAQELAAAQKALKKAEEEKARLEQRIADAKAQVARLESEQKKETLPIAPTKQPAGSPTSAAAPDNVTQSVEQVLKLMQQRLAVMKDVAGAKWAAKLPVEDPERESELTDRLVQKGQELGLRPEVVRGFIAAQMSASRQLQESLFETWRKSSAAVKPGADLQRELRPRIDQLSMELVGALAKLQPHLDKPTVQQLLRERAGAVLVGEGIDERVRDQALAPLVRR